MFVAIVLSFPLGLHFISHDQYPNKAWSTHVLTFSIVNTFFFLTWATTGMGFPWFFFPLVVWSILLIFHATLKNRAAQKQQLPVMQPLPVTVVNPPTETATFVNIPPTATVVPTEYQ
jgi:hypothetical protein